jgi:hypothetical protein
MGGLAWGVVFFCLTLGVPVQAPAEGRPEEKPVTISSTPPLQEVIVVFKTHFDIGYTDMAAQVVSRYRTTMIDQALEVCDASRNLPKEQRFVWTIPGWPMTRMLEDWPGQSPLRKKRIEEAFRNGWFVTHALPFTVQTEFLEPEDLIRGFEYSSRICLDAHLDLPRDAKMTDVPSHSWILPTVLRRAGVEFLHLGCNPASASPEVPMLFWWEGPDGSRVLTMYNDGDYGSTLKPPADWKYKTWLAVMHTGDNAGPPKPDAVEKLLEQARLELPAGVHIRMGRLSDFSDAILAEKAEIPVVRGDMPDTWIHGVLSDPQGTRISRNLGPQSDTLETLNTLLKIWRSQITPAEEVSARAHAENLRYGEHTWGLNIAKMGRPRLYGEAWKKAWTDGRYREFEDSWEEKRTGIRTAQKDVLETLEKNLETLAQSVKVSGDRVVVYNPLPWKRNGVVDIPLKAPLLAAFLRDLKTDQILPADCVEGKTLRFIAREVPPMGYRTYALCHDSSSQKNNLKVDTAQGVLENRFLRLRLDPTRASVASLFDKERGCELVDTRSPLGFGQYLYQRFSKADVDRYLKAYTKISAEWASTDLGKSDLSPEIPATSATLRNCTITYQTGANYVSATMQSPASEEIPHAVALTVTLYESEPAVDFAWTVTGKEADPWPEAGWLCFPAATMVPAEKSDGSIFRIWRLGGIVDPARDLVRSSNHDTFCLNGGMSVSISKELGLGICPLDSPLVSLGEPGLWQYSRTREFKKPGVFVNLFNNQWSTNYPQWISGSWTSRVRVWTMDCKKTDAEGLVTSSQEARVPLVGTLSSGPAGPLPVMGTGLQIQRTGKGNETEHPGILVTAFSRDAGSQEGVLRLYEQLGMGGQCRVRLPEGWRPTQVQPCDLRGRPQGVPIPVRDGEFQVEIQANAPLYLKFAEIQ